MFYWFPKITGRMYNERLGKIFAIWVTVAFNTTFIPLFWLGINGMNRRVGDYPEAFEGVNRFASISALILGTSFLLFVGNLVYSAVRGPKAGPNPWNARTIEWQIPSPPPQHNFTAQPRVISHPYDYGTNAGPHVVFDTPGSGSHDVAAEEVPV
jgi:cytochrome c oxidase subunit 1